MIIIDDKHRSISRSKEESTRKGESAIVVLPELNTLIDTFA